MNLQEVRAKIDTLDEQLVQLVEERLHWMEEIAAYKDKHSLSIFDPEREQAVLEHCMAQVQDSKYKEYVREAITQVMRICREFQKNFTQPFIFMVGMPGAGKTTVGKELANRLGLAFYDLDERIQETTGRTLQNIIIYDGEPAFREIEFQVMQEIIACKPGVIATGGGTVLSDKTVRLMQESGVIVFIQRDTTAILNDLDLEIRPLLKENIEYIFRLYEERCPIYEAVSQIKVQNATTVSEAVEEIIKALPKDMMHHE